MRAFIRAERIKYEKGKIMKINEIISIADALKTNELSEEVKLGRLNDVEGRVFCEIRKMSPSDFQGAVSLTDELSVPAPYSKMYVLYLLAMIAFSRSEYELYEKMLIDYENAFSEYARFYMRNK